jgi:hypothetical protein
MHQTTNELWGIEVTTIMGPRMLDMVFFERHTAERWVRLHALEYREPPRIVRFVSDTNVATEL